jgi:glycosyltransferase involved in cell wall biosynthesis
MKIAFIAHYEHLYGANRALLNLIDGLNCYQVESMVIVPKEGGMTEALRQRQVPFIVVPVQKWMLSVHRARISSPAALLRRAYHQWLAFGRLIQNGRCLPRLTGQLRQWESDIVYSNSAVTPVGMMLSRTLRLPHVWHLHEFASVDFPLTADWGMKISHWLIRKTATAIITNSHTVCEHYFGREPGQQVQVIYNGVAREADYDRLRLRAEQKVHDRTTYMFVLVGLLHPGKGQETAIRAFALLHRKYPQVRLLLVGSGQEQYVQSLRRLAMELGVPEQVTFEGYVTDPFEAYLQADAALMCSRYEGMGQVTVEAMAACLPVIGYDQAGTSELVTHGRSGLLYRGGPQELKRAMEQLVLNPAWGTQLGANGWQLAREKFSIETYARQVHNVLRSQHARGAPTVMRL